MPLPERRDASGGPRGGREEEEGQRPPVRPPSPPSLRPHGAQGRTGTRRGPALVLTPWPKAPGTWRATRAPSLPAGPRAPSREKSLAQTHITAVTLLLFPLGGRQLPASGSSPLREGTVAPSSRLSSPGLATVTGQRASPTAGREALLSTRHLCCSFPGPTPAPWLPHLPGRVPRGPRAWPAVAEAGGLGPRHAVLGLLDVPAPPADLRACHPRTHRPGQRHQPSAWGS